MSKISERFAHLSTIKQAFLAIEEMRSQINFLKQERSAIPLPTEVEPIAIIGMGCRFPGGANDPKAYWDIMRNGIDAIGSVPTDRWRHKNYYHSDPKTTGKTYVEQFGFLNTKVADFDAGFFGLAPRETVSMDPQQRLLLEVSWEALENAGQPLDKLTGTSTGVFIGIGTVDYYQMQMKCQDPNVLDAYLFTGNAYSVAAGRLSYILGLQGPSMAVDTACSSSLVTVHLACESLWTRGCHLALAGGVSLMLSPENAIILSRMRALAVDGRCKTFDASADGYGRGEGCGIVVLKRLSDAIADGDNILALIRGSAVNHDGRSSGLTVPNGLAQESVIQAALDKGKIDPHQVSYVEVHGTGTSLGDPIEVEALLSVLGKNRTKEDPLIIGSVKTNIGHLEAAAGIASLIKVVLAMQHQELPSHLHFKQPNPSIPWEKLPVMVPTEQIPWNVPAGQQRLAGVSSFGMSGTNAHLIVEEAPSYKALPTAVDRPFHILTLSAKNEPALKALLESFTNDLTNNANRFADICFTANTGRSHFAHRLAVIADSTETAQQQLAELTISALKNGSSQSQNTPFVAFLFTGQGSQYVHMGRELYETQPTFRRALEQCEEILRSYLDYPLLEVLYPSNGKATPLDQTAYTQPTLFAIEYALAQLWLSWGIQPMAVMGHSAGEYVAACIAGVFTLEDGLKLIAERARLMQGLPANGKMAAVFASAEQVASLLKPYEKEVAIAAINSPTNTVISGQENAVSEILQELQVRGIKHTLLQVSHAFHSPLMEPILEDFERKAQEITYSLPKIRLISNVTGKLIQGAEVSNAAYWRDHIRKPVLFAAGIEMLQAQESCKAFLEIGPNPVLIRMGQQCLPEQNQVWLPGLRRGKSDWQQLLQSLKSLYEQGATVNWSGFDRDYSRDRVILPTYPFQRERYWFESRESTSQPKTDLLQHFKDWLYEVEWQPKRHLSLVTNQSESPGHWVIFSDRGGVGSTLANLLEKHNQTCTLVFPDETSGVNAVGQLQINPNQPEEVQRLLQEVLESNTLPCRGFVHLWSLESTSTDQTTVESLQTDQLRNCGSVLHLVQALAQLRISEKSRLWLVTQGAHPIHKETKTLAVGQGALWGLGRVIAVEHPEIWGGLVDLDVTPPEKAATMLFHELWQPDGEYEVSLDKGERFVARLVRSKRENMLTETLNLRADGTYLLTGGLGGLGLKVARWMVEHGAKYLVLVGRRAPSPKVEAELNQIKATGAQITVVQADVARADEVAKVLAEINQSLPPLRGAIHLAGLLDDGVLLRQSWKRFAKVMAPKVSGAWNLHLQTQHLPLDFFVLFSSIASLLGSPGQGNYATANAFLDTLAQYRRLQGLPAVSISWSVWNEVGMAATVANQGEQRWNTLGVGVIDPPLGLSMLEHLLQPTSFKLGVLPIDWLRLLKQLPEGGIPPLFTEIAHEFKLEQTTSKPSLELLEKLKTTPASQRRAVLLSHIQREVASVLGLASSRTPAPQLGFFEMGMDSLMTLDFKNRLQAQLGQNLPTTLTFEYPTIEALTHYLLNQVLSFDPSTTEDSTADKQAQEHNKFLAEMTQMGENELEALINKELEALTTKQWAI